MVTFACLRVRAPLLNFALAGLERNLFAGSGQCHSRVARVFDGGLKDDNRQVGACIFSK